MAETSLIDTMARAIGDHYGADFDASRHELRSVARAALRSLIDAGPTETMLKAMHDAVPLCDRARCDNVREVARAENLPKFAAAMRAALEEADNGAQA